MKKLELFSVLAHPSRLQILELLKNPSAFPMESSMNKEEVGICVLELKEALGISQSTTSQHLAILKNAGFLTSRKIGKYNYFKRNEEMIKKLANYVYNEL